VDGPAVSRVAAAINAGPVWPGTAGFSAVRPYEPSMSDDGASERARRSFEEHDAFLADDGAYRVETTAFDGRVEIGIEKGDEDRDGRSLRYRLVVRAPTLSAATEESIGPNLEEGWFETYERRLEDAPGAVRDDVELEELTVHTGGGEAVAEFTFTLGDVDRAPAVAKAVTEYAEGTYVEGIVPGFTYRPPVSDLLGRARKAGEGEGTGPMPL